MKVLFILNSDFGVEGTIGMRALPTAKKLKSNVTILCRDSKFINDIKITKVVPFGNKIMKIINGLKVYIFKNLNAYDLNNKIFEFFLNQKLSRIKLERFDIVHTWDFFPETFRKIKEENPTIVIIKDMTMSLNSILKKKKNNEKYWLNMETEPKKNEIDSFKFIDYFITPSKITKESLVNENVDPNKILEISYGVDYEKFKPRDQEDNIFRVAFVGNVNNRKGIGYLVDAWKKLKLRNSELNIYGRVYPEVEDIFQDHKKYNISLHGYVNLEKELPKNNVLVHPSLQETTPKSLKEGMACGLVPIVTHHSGPDYKDKQEGFIVDEQDSDQIAERIKMLYENKLLLKTMSEKSREFAKKKSWKSYGEEVIENYKKVIKN